MRRISIFGATGSIGESTYDLICREGGAAAFHTVALTGGHNVARLAEMARTLRAEVAVTAHEENLPALREALSGSGVHAAAGPHAIIEAADREADWVMSAIVGAAGLVPGMRALAHGSALALANKESLVTAGELLLSTARAHGATILPVDSEHSAIFQALVGEDLTAVDRIILTASGGALRDWPMDRLAHATLAETLAHPNWSMGQRITIDSASMFNKALEVIEARYLFGVSPNQLSVVIHPQSIIHSMVKYKDTSIVAQLGTPDMRVPIAYGLSWPERITSGAQTLDFHKLKPMTFEAIDDHGHPDRFPGLKLAWQSLNAASGTCAVLNAANEIAVEAFLNKQIRFDQIHQVNTETLAKVQPQSPQSLPDLLALDAESRAAASEVARACLA